MVGGSLRVLRYRDRYPNEPYIPYEKRTAYDLVDDYEKLPGVSKNIKVS
jgi:hypothetical protein